jgi:hypothetical protein
MVYVCYFIQKLGAILGAASEDAMTEIISRDDARTRGLKHYFTGVACKHGHISERFVSNGACALCSRSARAKYVAENPAKIAAQNRKFSRTPHRVAKRSEYKKRRREKIADLIAVLRTEMPELLKEMGLS